MKKILFIVTQSEFGGAQHFLAHLIDGLRVSANHYEIVVAAGPRGDDKAGLLSFLEKKGINTRHLKHLKRGINPLFDFLGLIEIRKLIKKEKPDTIFLCSSKAGVLGSLAARISFRVNPRNYLRKSAKSPKVIYRVGGWVFNDPRSSLSRAFYKFIEKFSAKWKDIIIFNSEHDRKQAIELKIKSKKKLLTIYNGIDIKKLDFLLREKARKELLKKIPDSKFQILNSIIIGTIANLYPAKGLEYLIEASYKLQATSYKLIFIVIGEGREREKLENLIEKYHLEKNFFLPGAIPDAYKYLKAFDIFVLSSVKEGFPWTILEAMAAEVPIVATKVGGVPEIIQNNQSGIIIEPKNLKQLAEAIKKLIKNPELKNKLSREARKTVEHKFTLNKMASKVEKLL